MFQDLNTILTLCNNTANCFRNINRKNEDGKKIYLNFESNYWHFVFIIVFVCLQSGLMESIKLRSKYLTQLYASAAVIAK